MEELIREMLAAMITEEMLKDAAREAIEEHLNYSVKELILGTATDILREKTDAYIRERVDEQFMKPVKTDDGWGNVEYYDTFEQFVRDQVKNNLSNSWEVRTKVERQIDEKMKKAKENIAKKIANKDFADEVIAEFSDEVSKGYVF